MRIRVAHAPLLLLTLALGACGKDSLDQTRVGKLTTARQITLGNLTTVLVDPDGASVDVTWRAYNTKGGGALRPPFEELELSTPTERHTVSDQDVSNGQLVVDGTAYSLDLTSEVVLVRFGAPVKVVPADPAIVSTRPADLVFD